MFQNFKMLLHCEIHYQIQSHRYEWTFEHFNFHIIKVSQKEMFSRKILYKSRKYRFLSCVCEMIWNKRRKKKIHTSGGWGFELMLLCAWFSDFVIQCIGGVGGLFFGFFSSARGTSILGEVGNVEIPGATQQLRYMVYLMIF